MSATGNEVDASGNHSECDGDILRQIESNELVCAASDGLLDKVDYLIGAGHDVTGKVGRAALNYAAGNGHAAVVNSLLAAGAQVDGSWGSSLEDPLIRAAEGGHEEVVKLLLEAGANIEATSKFGATALTAAARNGCTKTVTSLLAAGAHVEGVQVCAEAPRSQLFSKNPLIEAAGRGHIKVVRLLIENGADIDADDSCNATALSIASKGGHLDVLRVLIQAGAKVNLEEAMQTPLYLAVKQGHADIVRELLTEGGADPDSGKYEDIWYDESQKIRTSHKETPLMKAAASGRRDIVRMLLKAGADPNISCKGGWTALLTAVRHTSDEDMIEMLLKAGADPFACLDKFHSQPSEWVLRTSMGLASHNEEIHVLLRRYMDRRKAAAVSVLPDIIPVQFRRYILSLACSFRLS